MLKFNVDGAAGGKPGLASVRGVLRNDKGEVLFMVSKHVVVCDSNETELLDILEALWCFSRFFQGTLFVESDSSNVVSRVSNWKSDESLKCTFKAP